MKKIVFAVSTALGMLAANASAIELRTEFTPTGKTSTNSCLLISKFNLDSKVQSRKPFHDLIASSNYCLNEALSYKKVHLNNYEGFERFKDISSSNANVKMLKRYKLAYASLQTIEDKVQFVDFFLKKAPQKFYFRVNNHDTGDKLLLAVVGKFTPESGPTGSAFYVFGPDNLTGKLLAAFKDIIATPIKTKSHEINKLVYKVIFGNKKK